LNWLFKIV